jgi:deazaflavin-dependent oxidoreductase (nitroreductase family)
MAEHLSTSTEPRRTHTRPRIPLLVPLFNPLARRLMRLGVPLGPNALLSVRGRKSGVVRTAPVALVEVDGRRWIVGTFGEVNWVRNLRAAGEGTLAVGRRRQYVHAVELSRSEATDFFAEVLGPYVSRLRFGRMLLDSILGAGEILDDPRGAAERRPVFRLEAAKQP